MKQKISLIAFALLSFAHGEDISLFNGKDLAGWEEPLGKWSVVGAVSLDGDKPKAFVTEPGTGVTVNCTSGGTVDITSTAEHGDAQIHVEFNVPKNSNSGIYVMGRYEVQVFDSFGKDPIEVHDCGALYQRWDPKRGKGNEGYEGHTPAVNACKAPGEWQSFDITFRAPRFNEAGEKVENAKFVKVVHNGVVIHENIEMTGPTRGAKFNKEAAMGPIRIQGSHGPVAYRNCTITPLSLD